MAALKIPNSEANVINLYALDETFSERVFVYLSSVTCRVPGPIGGVVHISRCGDSRHHLASCVLDPAFHDCNFGDDGCAWSRRQDDSLRRDKRAWWARRVVLIVYFWLGTLEELRRRLFYELRTSFFCTLSIDVEMI